MLKSRRFALLALVAVLAAVGGKLVAAQPAQAERGGPAQTAIWSEIKWPFPPDLWGTGLAFRCKAADCGSEVYLYLRPKLGFCNCTSAIDDEMVDKVGDLELVAGERKTLGPGRAIDVRWMKGLSRTYLLAGPTATAKSGLSIAFHDRCDLIVATAAIAGEQPEAQEAPVLEFLNSDRVLRWLEVRLGL